MSKVITSPCGNVTTLAGDDIENSVTITDAAKTQIVKILESEPEGSFFRMGVRGGGCSGFEYLFAIDTEYLDDDEVVTDGDMVAAIDGISMGLLKGSTLDYTTDIYASRFVVNNPHVSSQCGCGTSFSLDPDML